MIALISIVFLLGVAIGALLYKHWHYDADVALYHTWVNIRHTDDWNLLSDQAQVQAVSAMAAHERLHR